MKAKWRAGRRRLELGDRRGEGEEAGVDEGGDKKEREGRGYLKGGCPGVWPHSPLFRRAVDGKSRRTTGGTDPLCRQYLPSWHVT